MYACTHACMYDISYTVCIYIYHIISYHIISYHIISYHIISYHIHIYNHIYIYHIYIIYISYIYIIYIYHIYIYHIYICHIYLYLCVYVYYINRNQWVPSFRICIPSEVGVSALFQPPPVPPKRRGVWDRHLFPTAVALGNTLWGGISMGISWGFHRDFMENPWKKWIFWDCWGGMSWWFHWDLHQDLKRIRWGPETIAK